jgi:hypothetical protein
MKLMLVLLLITVSSVAYGQRPRCDESLWRHVYIGGQPNRFETAKDRLKILDSCKTITGTIVSMVPKPDGDYHIQVKLDPGQSNLLNAKNRKAKGGQHGYLVIEPICQKRPTQPTALKGGPCTGFRQVLPALVQFRKDLKKHIGTHVEVTGAFINDMEHGWNEIHPITSILIK